MRSYSLLLRGTAVLLAAAMFSSCHSTSYPRRTAATGALIGAGTGALIGSGSGNAGKGALIGATVGAIAGGAYGKRQVRRSVRYGYGYGYGNYQPAYNYRPYRQLPRRNYYYQPAAVYPYYY